MFEQYNPYFNQTTVPNYQQPNYQQNLGFQYQKPTQNNEQTNTFQWVQGQAGAEAYLLGPNQKVILMDSDAPVIYYKSTDINGRYLPMKTYDLVERNDSNPGVNRLDTSSFVHRDEIEQLVADAIEKYLSEPVSKEA